MIKISAIGDILASVLAEDKNCVVFLHNTRNEETASQILREGFRFENQITYSTDRINHNDKVEINYFLVERKEYGKYTVIIEIEKNLFNEFNKLSDKSDIHFEDIITVEKPVLSDNDEYVYTLSHHYIKGYLDIRTGKFIDNKDFNPSYKPDTYLSNYKRLKYGEE